MSHTHGICEDAEDSAEVVYKHREFLLLRMLKGEEDVEWSETNLFRHLVGKFPVRVAASWCWLVADFVGGF